jgi:hypothetical protein
VQASHVTGTHDGDAKITHSRPSIGNRLRLDMR